MDKKIQTHFDKLLQERQNLVNSIPPLVLPTDAYGGTKTIPGESESSIVGARIPAYQSWLSSAANLIDYVSPMDSYFGKECRQVLSHDGLKTGIPSTVVKKMLGLLKAAKEEWEHGLLGRVEYIVAAATFDDFLDHAASYHKGNRKIESAVLASAVLEDTMKRVASKNGIDPSGKTLEPLIDELVKTGVLTLVKAKRIRGWAGVRNHALHAEWDEFDIRDVGELIKGTRELIEDFL